jgi:hypothetical protein
MSEDGEGLEVRRRKKGRRNVSKSHYGIGGFVACSRCFDLE